MKSSKIVFLGKAFLFAGLAAWMGGCGGGNDGILTISPGGPTIVQKGETLQLTASRNDVTWSVQGGNGNGTITGAGLYTPPGTLPAGIPLVNVQADSTDGQTATAQVSLRTANSLVFGQESKVNADPLDNDNGAYGFETEIGGVADRLAVRLGSVQEDTVFADSIATPSPFPSVFYNQALNFGPFSNPANLSSGASNPEVPIAIETNSLENPGILFVEIAEEGFHLFFSGSDDHGAHFNNPVPLFPASPSTNLEISAFMRTDDQDKLHVVFFEDQPTPSPEVETIFYVQSDNGGASWTDPVPVFSSTAVGLAFPTLAVDPSGNNIYVSWTENDSGDTNIFFAASSDGGSQFGTPVPVTDSNIPSLSRVSLGTAGQIYIVYPDEEGGGERGVFLKTSTNGGISFGDPVQVNSSPAHMDTIALPMISVDDLGRIDVIWSADPDNSGDADTLMYARSLDDGAHFSDNIPLASGPSGTLILTRALRHDAAGRLYLQYSLGGGFGSGETHDIFTLVGE